MASLRARARGRTRAYAYRYIELPEAETQKRIHCALHLIAIYISVLPLPLYSASSSNKARIQPSLASTRVYLHTITSGGGARGARCWVGRWLSCIVLSFDRLPRASMLRAAPVRTTTRNPDQRANACLCCPTCTHMSSRLKNLSGTHRLRRSTLHRSLLGSPSTVVGAQT